MHTSQVTNSLIEASFASKTHHDEPIDHESTKEQLVLMMLDMYWIGVHREIRHILASLVELQSMGLSEVEKACQLDNEITGFDAFIDQISESSIEPLPRRSRKLY
jgi:hypothetical protein